MIVPAPDCGLSPRGAVPFRIVCQVSDGPDPELRPEAVRTPTARCRQRFHPRIPVSGSGVPGRPRRRAAPVRQRINSVTMSIVFVTDPRIGACIVFLSRRVVGYGASGLLPLVRAALRCRDGLHTLHSPKPLLSACRLCGASAVCCAAPASAFFVCPSGGVRLFPVLRGVPIYYSLLPTCILFSARRVRSSATTVAPLREHSQRPPDDFATSQSWMCIFTSV